MEALSNHVPVCRDPFRGSWSRQGHPSGAPGRNHGYAPHLHRETCSEPILARARPLGEKARAFMDQGELVPDELVLEMLFDRVAKEDCAKGYLLDGFPRTLGQAEALGHRLGELEAHGGKYRCAGRGHRKAHRGQALLQRLRNDLSLVLPPAPKRRDLRQVLWDIDPAQGRHEGSCAHAPTRISRERPNLWLITTHSRSGLCTVDGQNAPDDVFIASLACLGVNPVEQEAMQSDSSHSSADRDARKGAQGGGATR